MRLRIFTSLIKDRDDLKRHVPDVFIFNVQGGSFDIHATKEDTLKIITWTLERGLSYEPLIEHPTD